MHEQLKLENQLCFRLYSASRLMTQAYHPLLAPYGLTYPQYLVMMVLWEKDAQPVNDIAKRLLLETNTVTPLLKRMEEQGLLTRRRNNSRDKDKSGSHDARQVIVSLTPQGQELQDKLASVPFKLGAAVACDSLTPQSVPAMYGMLDDIIDKLKD